jgi:capsular polysaccharide biosynthesis protein
LEEINLYELLRYYRKKALLVVAATFVGLLLAAIYTWFVQKPVYKSSATLIVVGAADKTSNQGSIQLNNYTQLFTSRRVLEPVMNTQAKNMSYVTFASRVKATNSKDTELIGLSVSDSSPRRSQALANGIIGSFRGEVKRLYGTDNVSVVDGASLPTTPANVRPLTQLLLGAFGGLLLSLLGLFFMFDFTHSQTTNMTASERLVYEKTRQAEKTKTLALKIEQKAAKARVKQERRNARAERRAALLQSWAESRAVRAVRRAEKRSRLLEARVKQAELKVETRKAKQAARQAIKQAKIAASTERRAEKARLKAEKMKLAATEKAKRLRAEERRRKDEERRQKEAAATQLAQQQAQAAARREAEKAETERLEAEKAQQKAEAAAEARRKKLEATAEAKRKKAETEAKAKAEKEAEAMRAAMRIEARAQNRVRQLQVSRAKKAKQKRKKTLHAISLHDLSSLQNNTETKET